MDEPRPNPDALLSRLQDETANRTRGHLKIFFGACPGVGKTFSMLEEARIRKAAGVDVVAGIVETHGRAETQALAEGLEILPLRQVAYRGVTLREFDLDGALKRKPELLLLDELAHTNAPESRHARRWQDARELLAAGIDVYTTLNVQHIESLNDIVAQITGVAQRETVPDSIVAEADEIVLVDLPPEELLQRLADGKVYFPEQAAHAAEKFFRKSNLIALREMSLRFMANQVNAQVQVVRHDQTVERIWPTAERLLVCIGPSPSSAKLVRSTHRMATLMRAEWVALTVDTSGSNLSTEARERLVRHQRLAQRLGAEVVTTVAECLPEEVIRYARSRNVTKIIVGKPVLPWWRERLGGTLVDRIVRLSGEIDVYVIRGEGEPARVFHYQPPKIVSQWVYYLRALLIVIACTAVAWLIYPHLDLANLIMVYLVGVMITAMRGRRGPAIFASILSVLAFDLLFVPPRFTMRVSDASYLFTFVVMLVAALLISTLTLRIRRQAEMARLSALRTAAQHRLSRQLIEARELDTLLETAAREISEAGECTVHVLLADESGQLYRRVAQPIAPPLTEKEIAVAEWVYAHGEPAGRGTDTLASSDALYLPLRASREPLGVIGIGREGFTPDPDYIRLIEAMAGQVALALEVDRLEDEQRKAQVQIEAERLRSSILGSVSHDLRTPLATIIGSAGSLLETWGQFDDETRRTLIQDIHNEAERLSRLIGNLLEMTRLEGGALTLRREPQPLEEVVGAALATLEHRLKDRKLETKIPDDLPLVDVDGILVEHVIINLIENALTYSPADKPITLAAHTQNDQVVAEVIDQGPGLKPGEEARIFEKFYRGSQSARTSGVGLGLAICKGIVEAHGGKIEAHNKPDGGTVFRLTLPASAECGMRSAE